MKVILLRDVKGVGHKFDEKNVADGYAMNFLIPRSFALIADKSGIAKAKQLKEQNERKLADENQKIQEKETKRLEKHLELEKFRKEQKGAPLD